MQYESLQLMDHCKFYQTFIGYSFKLAKLSEDAVHYFCGGTVLHRYMPQLICSHTYALTLECSHVKIYHMTSKITK